MITESLVICMKISQEIWIKKLLNGSVWFGFINNYIKQAEETGNNEQGDKYEGIFAHVKKDSKTIRKYQERFGADLEIINDSEYCFLRRKSCKKVAAFCMYGVKNSDLEITDIYYDDTGKMKGHFRCDIDQKMYNSFLRDGTLPESVAGYYCSAGHLIGAIEKALNVNHYNWKRKMVTYDIDIEKEFIIEPTSEYPELWHKRKDLSYQHEVRFAILDSIKEEKGIEITIDPIKKNSGNFALGELYFEGTADVEEKDELHA